MKLRKNRTARMRLTLGKNEAIVDKWFDYNEICDILLLSTTESIVSLKSRDFLGFSFFYSCAILLRVEFKGPPHGEDSVVDSRNRGVRYPLVPRQEPPFE